MKKETYRLACRKYTESINPKTVRNKHNRSMIQSNWAICGSKKSRFIKEHQAMGLLSNLGIKTLLSKVPLLNILFEYNLKDEYLLFIMQKNTRNINPKVIKIKNNRKIMYQDVLFAIIKSLHLFHKDLVYSIV